MKSNTYTQTIESRGGYNEEERVALFVPVRIRERSSNRSADLFALHVLGYGKEYV